MMSRLSEEVSQLISSCFPRYHKVPEFYVKYRGEQLYYDFLIRELKVLIEVQGVQHYKYVPHFHKDPFYFFQQRKRDVIKKEWAQENGYTLIEIKEGMDLDRKLFIDLVAKSMAG
jgi:hypothetical protein